MSSQPGPASSWRALRFLQLLVFIVVALLALPVLARFRIVLLVIQLLLLNGILVAMSASHRGSVRRAVLIVAWLGNVALQAAVLRVASTSALHVVADVSGALVFALCVVYILDYVFASAEITGDAICAAIVAYLFLVLGFARAFSIIHAAAPGSFDLPAGLDPDLELIYFSFVTIATLGYGDIVPRLPTAQMLAALEAVTGQFFVAVLIAWLVSVHAAQGRSQR